MALPPLPLALLDPINVELHAHDACWPPEPDPDDIDHRRPYADSCTVLVLPNRRDPYLPAADPGYTLVHHATGIMASFYLQHSGLGGVHAKPYGTKRFTPGLLPPDYERPEPDHFYGYGVGRRLYLAAHALWPDIRWEDAALRSTSRSLRSRLPALDPYT